MNTDRPYRIMISGGGTGGHIYPAISIAQALKSTLANVEFLFVGAEGKMEMKKVPEAGFDIVGLWISGIQRKLTIDNLSFPIKLISSISKSFKLIKSFQPDVVVGVGGYASGPLLYAAAKKGIPTLIQEQNSYAGLTNKWLAGKVDKICVAYEGMEKYFPEEKIVVTGNPVRQDIQYDLLNKEASMDYFHLDQSKKTLLVIGGSLGARTINESLINKLSELKNNDIQVIWQTGSFYFQKLMEQLEGVDLSGIKVQEFIREMQYAYGAADLVISRAGALSIAELMLTGKPCILVPSPNVAEDHQTLNAKALKENEAAEIVKDLEAKEKLVEEAIAILSNKQQLKGLSENILKMAKPRAAYDIANEVIKLVA